KTFPVNPGGLQIGLQDMKYLGEKIVAQTGSSTAGMITDATKSLAKEKTATEVRQESTEGVLALQTVVDKLSNQILQPTAQAIYNSARQFFEDDVTFVSKNLAGDVLAQKVTRAELDKDRIIEVIGRRGLANKAHEIQNLTEALKILATP